MKQIKGFSEEYSFLSNFEKLENLFVFGEHFSTTEAAFQAAKMTSMADFEKIRLSEDPALAKKLGRKLPIRPQWNSMRDSIMKYLVFEKFAQNENLRNRLLNTGDAFIEETNYWRDTYWGVCQGVGQNKLGQILMEVRELIREGNYKMQKQRIDIVVDLETLGCNPTSPIIQINAMAFDLKTGEIKATFERVVDIKNSELTVDGNTLLFWLNTNPALLKEILVDKVATASKLPEINLSHKSVMNDFHFWLNQFTFYSNCYLWGKGILFDNNFINEHFKLLGLKNPISFRNDRDVRTIIELAAMKKNQTVKEFENEFQIQFDKSYPNAVIHDAKWDTLFEKEEVCLAYQILQE